MPSKADESLLTAALADYQKEDFDLALQAVEKYLQHDSSRPDAWTLAGMAKKALGDIAGARAAYLQAIARDPGFADAHTNLANLERWEGSPDEALAHYLSAFQLRPGSPAANNVGCVLSDLGRFEEAEQWHDKALELDAQAIDPLWDRALAHLSAGHYRAGFADYESRFQRGQPVPRVFSQPAWQGEELAGKTILLYGEQGYGDALQFLRFVPWVAARGGRVIVEILPPLARLVAGLAGVSVVVPLGNALPDFDVHASIMSLPHIFGLELDAIPGAPYLQAPDRAGATRRLNELGGQPAALKVGIVWAGNPGVKNDRFRSPRLDVLRPLWQLPGVQFFGLQKGDGKRDLQPSDPIIDLDGEIADFADTANFIAALDLIITSDTSVAHLAGALGKRTWVMLMQVADWRWLGAEGRSFWYPTVRQFRQAQRGDWASVSQALHTELASLLANRGDSQGQNLVMASFAAYQQGDVAAAARLIERTLDLEANRPDVWTLYGMICRRQGDKRCAAAAYREALRLKPDFQDALCNLGNLHKDTGQLEDAYRCYRQVLALTPDHLSALRELSDVERQLGRPAVAVDLARQALIAAPGDAALLNNLGAALSELGQLDAATAALQTVLAENPAHIEAEYNLGVLLHKRGHENEAARHFQAVVERDPAHARAHYNLGVVWQGLGDFTIAEQAYRRAVELDANYFSALFNLGALYSFTGRFADALSCEQRCLALNPSHLGARAEALHLAMKFCDWPQVIPEAQRLVDSIKPDGSLENELPPFVLLSLPVAISEGQQLAAARKSAHNLGASITPLPAIRPGPRQRLKIGYASSDFHDHATMHLMRGLFALHDRQQFAIHAYSWGPDDASPYRQQALADIEHFHELRGQGAETIAQQIRNDGIDILVDLKGYTRDCKSEIFAYRPAPVQAQYLGYPGTMGADFIDWIITDRIVTPPAAQADYSERFAYLPHCYQVNDSSQPIDEPPPSRAACGLPEDAIVFTCFCTHYKIDPLIWQRWMNILHGVPGSVLWLCSGQEKTEANLRREALASGIAAERLIFGKLMPKAKHLSRLRCADLFLDTYWYNGHTTASDALWAGVPVLTTPGDRFASRVGASLVAAVGMPELIADDLDAYQAMAIALGTAPDRLRALRDKLAANRLSTPLFDTAGFVRDLETLYQQIWTASCAAQESTP
ncbi:MAG: tetratricopeptide repeat protein [Azonexus sp.]